MTVDRMHELEAEVVELRHALMEANNQVDRWIGKFCVLDFDVDSLRRQLEEQTDRAAFWSKAAVQWETRYDIARSELIKHQKENTDGQEDE